MATFNSGMFFSDDPTGALIQLTAQGIQNAYLNLQAQYTLFKRTYKRHTNYASQMVFVSAQGGNCRLGSENTFKVTRNGDLVCETYFCAYMPVVGVDTTPNAFAKSERGFVTNRGLLNTGALGVSDGKYSHPTEYAEAPSHYNKDELQNTATSSIPVSDMTRAGVLPGVGTGNSSAGVSGLSAQKPREPTFPSQDVVLPQTSMNDAAFLPATTTASSVEAAQEFLTGSDHACVAYVNALGHAMIESARITIGGQDINGTLTGEFLHIWHQMQHKSTDNSYADSLFMYGDGTGAPLPETGNSAPQGILENVNPIFDEAHKYKLCKYKLKMPKPSCSSAVADARNNPVIEHDQLLTLRFFDASLMTANDEYQSGSQYTSGGLLGGEVHYSDISGRSIMGHVKHDDGATNGGQAAGVSNILALKNSRDGLLPTGFSHTLTTKIGHRREIDDQSVTSSLSAHDTLQGQAASSKLGGWNWQSEHPFEKYFQSEDEFDVVLPLQSDAPIEGFGIVVPKLPGNTNYGVSVMGTDGYFGRSGTTTAMQSPLTNTGNNKAPGNHTSLNLDAGMTTVFTAGTGTVPIRVGGVIPDGTDATPAGDWIAFYDAVGQNAGTVGQQNDDMQLGSDAHYTTTTQKFNLVSTASGAPRTAGVEFVVEMDAYPKSVTGINDIFSVSAADGFVQTITDGTTAITTGWSPGQAGVAVVNAHSAKECTINNLGLTKVKVALSVEKVSGNVGSTPTDAVIRINNIRIIDGGDGYISTSDYHKGWYLAASNEAMTTAMRKAAAQSGSAADPNAMYFGWYESDLYIPHSPNYTARATTFLALTGTQVSESKGRAFVLGPFGSVGGTSSGADKFAGLVEDLSTFVTNATNAKSINTQQPTGSGATCRVRKRYVKRYTNDGTLIQCEPNNTRLEYSLSIENPGTGYKVNDTLRIAASSIPKQSFHADDVNIKDTDIRICVKQIQPDAVKNTARQDSTVNVTYKVEIVDAEGNSQPGCVAAATLVAQPKNDGVRGISTIEPILDGPTGVAGSIDLPGEGPHQKPSGYFQPDGASLAVENVNPYAAEVLPWTSAVLNEQCVPRKVYDGTVVPFRMGAMSHIEFTVFDKVPAPGSLSNPASQTGLLSTVRPGMYVKLSKQNSTKNPGAGFGSGAATIYVSTALENQCIQPYNQDDKPPLFACSQHAPLSNSKFSATLENSWQNGNFWLAGQLPKTILTVRPNLTVNSVASTTLTLTGAIAGLPLTGGHAVCATSNSSCCDATSFYEAACRSMVHPLGSSSGMTLSTTDPEFSNEFALTNTDPLGSAGAYDTIEFLALCPSLVGGQKLQRINDSGAFSVVETSEDLTGGVLKNTSGMVADGKDSAGGWGADQMLVNNSATLTENPEDPSSNLTEPEILKRRARLSTLQAVGSVCEEHVRGSDMVTSVSSKTTTYKDGQTAYGNTSRGHYSQLNQVKSRVGAVAHQLRSNFVTTSDYASGTVALSNGSKKALKDGFAKRAHMSALGNCDHPDGEGRCVKVMVPIPFWYSPVYQVQSEGRTQSLPVIALQYHDVNIALQLRSMEDLVQTDHEARNMGLRCTSATGLGGALATGTTGRQKLDATQETELQTFLADNVMTAATKNGGFAFETKSSTIRKTFAGNTHCFASDVAAWGGVHNNGAPMWTTDKSKMAAYTGQSGRTDLGARSHCIPALGGTGNAHAPGNESGQMSQRMSGNMISGHIMVMTIFLDTTERKLFAQHEHEFLLKQVQTAQISQTPMNQRSGAPWSINMKLPFNHPVTSLYWVLQRPESEYTRNYFRYEATQMAGDELMVSASLKLNNHNREPGMDQIVARCAQPQTYFDTAPAGGIGSATDDPGSGSAKNIYMYSFAQHPGKWWPSGAMNFSRVDDAQLSVTLKSHASQAHFGHNYCYAGGGYRKLADEIEFVCNASSIIDQDAKNDLYYGQLKQGVNMRVYAHSYNILRISSGMGAIRYAN